MPIVPAICYIFYPGGNNQPITLGDDAVGDRISGATPQFDPQSELVKFGGAAFGVLIEHGNGIHSLTWRVDRNHLTLAAAEQFRLDHPASLPVILGIAPGILQELNHDGTTRFFQNCVRPKIKCVSWDGQSTIFEYSVQFGKVTRTINL